MIPEGAIPWVLGAVVAALLGGIGFLLGFGVKREIGRMDAKASGERMQAAESRLVEMKRDLEELAQARHEHAKHIVRLQEQIAAILERMNG